MRSTDFSPSTERPGLALLLAACVGLAACGPEHQDAAVPAGQADGGARGVTLSGVSAGAYMAVQTHVALADRIAGIGVVAGGPYHCAAGQLAHALGRCLSGNELDAASLITATREAAAAGTIADPRGLADSRIWVFHSPADDVVSARVGDALVDFYRGFVANDQIEVIDDVVTAHGWPTVDAGNACLERGGDFINACDFDAAGHLLAHLYGELRPPPGDRTDAPLARIDLSAYFEDGSSVAHEGYAYVPASCRTTPAECRLHVAFHGCRQGSEFVGERFAVHAGLNAWAEGNGIVVVYPQVESSPFNPQGCWDWWGYTGADYDRRSGKQVAGIAAIIAMPLDRIIDSAAE